MADRADHIATPEIDVVLKDRGRMYGDYGDMSYLIQCIKQAMHDQQGWGKIGTAQREALDMIAVKMGRIVTGGNAAPDNWIDIQGYAKLGQAGEKQ